MQRISSTNARPDVNGIGKHGFHSNEDLPGQDATYLTPTWLNAIQEELSNLLELHGIQLDPNDNAQLYGLLATDADLLALSEAIEQRISALAAITATKAALDQSVSYLMAELGQHKTASNPHPQYLLASTFGVHLLMTANNQTTPIDDKHNVLGWNGVDGNWVLSTGTIDWGKSRSGSIEFSPFRAYGTFLLRSYISTADGYNINVRVLDENNNLIQAYPIASYTGGAKTVEIKEVFNIPKNAKAIIDWSVRAGYVKKAALSIGLYVDDRVKVFTPVGLTSIVDNTDFSESNSSTTESDYSSFPNYQWFYADVSGRYFELSALSTLESPVNKIPHYNRSLFASNLNEDLFIVVQVAKQTIESDYTPLDTQLLRAQTDESGNVVVSVPYAMRNIETPNAETLVYTFAYYADEISLNGHTFPAGSLNGEQKIYSRP